MLEEQLAFEIVFVIQLRGTIDIDKLRSAFQRIKKYQTLL
jgi:hypothetical protein